MLNVRTAQLRASYGAGSRPASTKRLEFGAYPGLCLLYLVQAIHLQTLRLQNSHEGPSV